MTSSAAGAMTVIGKARPRIDGPLKVTGYGQVHLRPQLSRGCSTPCRSGPPSPAAPSQTIDTARARQMPGVRAVFKSGDLGKISAHHARTSRTCTTWTSRGRRSMTMSVRYYGQYVALVVADTFEQAKAAADAVAVTYKAEKANVDHHLEADTANVASERGDADAGFADGAGHDRCHVRDRHGNAQPDRDPCHHRRARRRYADPLRNVPRRREPSQRGCRHARPATRQGARDQQVPRLGVWQQALPVVAVARSRELRRSRSRSR